MDALDAAWFVSNSALSILSFWAALEAVFSPSTSELRFRVSALIASYLEQPGRSRYERQRIVAGLYDKRSAAAHGRAKHDVDDLVATFALLREVTIKIIEAGQLPTKTDLERRLFGDDNSVAPATA
jgi:hypothetical protein